MTSNYQDWHALFITDENIPIENMQQQIKNEVNKFANAMIKTFG